MIFLIKLISRLTISVILKFILIIYELIRCTEYLLRFLTYNDLNKCLLMFIVLYANMLFKVILVTNTLYSITYSNIPTTDITLLDPIAVVNTNTTLTII